jgi:DeoR family suf operon transcriptional repressor
MSAKVRQESTRSKILHFLKIKGRAAISEMSHAFRITPMAVGRHVRELESAGLVLTNTERRPKGRPAAVCSLTDLGDTFFPKAYDRFSSDLIRAVACLDGKDKVDQIFEKLKNDLIQRCAGRINGNTPEDRIKQAVAMLCEQGYMAEYRKKNSNTFVITEHNCAIAHVAREYQQVCHGELCFLSQVLGATVERQAHLVKGDSKCSYLVQFGKSSSKTPQQPPAST